MIFFVKHKIYTGSTFLVALAVQARCFLRLYHHYYIIALNLQCNLTFTLGSYMGDAQPTILLHFIPKPGFRTAVQIFEELHSIEYWLWKFNK